MSKISTIIAVIKALQPLFTQLGPLVKQIIQVIRDNFPDKGPVVGAAPVPQEEVEGAVASLQSTGVSEKEARELLAN